MPSIAWGTVIPPLVMGLFWIFIVWAIWTVTTAVTGMKSDIARNAAGVEALTRNEEWQGRDAAVD